MSLYVVEVGSDRAVVMGGQVVCAYDPQVDDDGCLEMLESVAVSLSSIHDLPIQRKSIEPTPEWDYDTLLAEHDFTGTKDSLVYVQLNHFDDDGNQVDSSGMVLSEADVSGIVDHASQLAIVMRRMGSRDLGIDAFDQVFSELETALVRADVIEPHLDKIATLALQ